MRSIIFLNAIVGQLMFDCVAGPDYEEPGPNLPSKFSESAYRPTANVDLNPWWPSLRDKRFSELVHSGMNDNLSVQAALQRVAAAEAAVTIADVAAGCMALAAAVTDLAVHDVELNVAIGGGSSIEA